MRNTKGEQLMIAKEELFAARERTLEYFKKAGIAITDEEAERIEIIDFDLDRLDELGLEILTYVNERRYCAKELILFPGQICAEHRHPPQPGEKEGKRETFRCRWGEVYLYVPGEPAEDPMGTVPLDKEDCFTVWNEIILRPGQQYTIEPNTLHWFQGGAEGAVVSEFSSHSDDPSDIFTDPGIVRERT